MENKGLKRWVVCGWVCVGALALGCSSAPKGPTMQERRAAIRDAYSKTYRGAEGFQAARWGMPLEEVRAAIPEAELGVDGVLRLKTTIADAPAEVSFGFLKERLAAVDVFFPEVKDELAFRGLLKDLLTRKYGTPRHPREVRREVKRGLIPQRFAADLAPQAPTPETLEGTLAAKGAFKLVDRWVTGESLVNLGQWRLPDSGVMSIQYESAFYAPGRTDLDRRTFNEAREELVKEL
ncbi:hypothetical protein LZ198_33485 [Myxococcus sp. K15C18031901]|uniref:hypothetical protein n=1 Tax=Myxococcus dinghuensis TaxID=2906761 RepID=UPI0020A78D86|nr:hypothetical protein [Myxococcus dinghuensis]MCP3103809.1 hypothetical protein [Myxococcus dinghuensis]